MMDRPSTDTMMRLVLESRAVSHRLGDRAAWIADEVTKRYPDLSEYRNRIYNWAVSTLAAKAVYPLPWER